MEEDIKILEKIIDCRKIDGIFTTNEVVFEAIENLLKERQADKDRIKELEEENKQLREFYMACDKAKIQTATQYCTIRKQGYIEGYAERDALAKKICEDCIKVEKNRNYIPKSLVREKIEELKEKRDKLWVCDSEIDYWSDIIDRFKELLGEE